MKPSWIRTVLFIVLAAMTSGCMTVPEEPEKTLEEKIIGTWIMPEEKGTRKYVFGETGRDEYYISKTDTLPYYWSEYETGETLFDDEGTAWIQITSYSVEPFSEERSVAGNTLVSVSDDGSELCSYWSADEVADLEDIRGDPVVAYRQGTSAADEIPDVPHVSDHIALWYSGPVFLWIMGTNDPEVLGDLEEEAESDEEITLTVLEWEDFVGSTEDIVADFTVINEFENPLLIPGLIHILRGYEDFPVSLTWNSGLAIASNNYEIAGESYAMYIDDPEAYGEDNIMSMLNYSISPEVWFSTLLDW